MRLKRPRQSLLEEEPKEQEYWLSYSDLMAGLLMVFALLLFTALHHYQQQVLEVRDLLEVRARIAASLVQAFEDNGGLGVEVDTITGVIRLRDAIFFDQNSTQLRLEGLIQLGSFAPRYFGVLFSRQEYIDQLEEVAVEGHTNDDGTYMYNLDLSQKRANAVMEFLLSAPGVDTVQLKKYVTANGRSFSRIVLRPDGTVDKERSRRIEIRFRLKDEEVIRQLLERLRVG